VRLRLAAEVKALHGANAEARITALNPVIRGWAAYYQTVVSKRSFPRWITTFGSSPTGGRSASEQIETLGSGPIRHTVADPRPCARQHHTASAHDSAPAPCRKPAELACAGCVVRRTSFTLSGRWRSNAPPVPDNTAATPSRC
jgi:group II intron maturase